MMSERETLLQKLWSSQNEVKMLTNMNSEIIEQIDSVKSTLARQRSKSPKKKEKTFNPLLTQLDNMKSTY